MLGKIIGVICFICAAFSFFTLPGGIYVAASLFVSGAAFWMLGVCQSSLEKIEYFAEWQKNLLEKGRDQNKRIVYLLEKIAGEEHQAEEEPAQNTAQEKKTVAESVMMNCHQCGTEINRLATICPKCKTKFDGGRPLPDDSAANTSA